MAGVAVADLSRLQVVDGIEDGHEHAVDRIGRQQVVGVGDAFGRADPLQALRTDDGAADGHEQRGGYALAADVGNDEGYAVVVDAEEVVEVAADILCGLHRGVDVDLVAILGEGREHLGQDVLLDVAGRGQVFLQRLQLCVLLLRLVDEAYLLDGLLDGKAQVVHVDGLRGKVEGAVVHGLTDVLHVAVGTHHDDAQGGIAHLVHLRQQGQTVHLGHVDVGEDDLDVGRVVQDGEGLQTVVGEVELVLAVAYLASEVLLHQQLQGSLVVDA